MIAMVLRTGGLSYQQVQGSNQGLLVPVEKRTSKLCNKIPRGKCTRKKTTGVFCSDGRRNE